MSTTTTRVMTTMTHGVLTESSRSPRGVLTESSRSPLAIHRPQASPWQPNPRFDCFLRDRAGPPFVRRSPAICMVASSRGTPSVARLFTRNRQSTQTAASTTPERGRLPERLLAQLVPNPCGRAPSSIALLHLPHPGAIGVAMPSHLLPRALSRNAETISAILQGVPSSNGRLLFVPTFRRSNSPRRNVECA